MKHLQNARKHSYSQKLENASLQSKSWNPYKLQEITSLEPKVMKCHEKLNLKPDVEMQPHTKVEVDTYFQVIQHMRQTYIYGGSHF